MSEKTDEDGCPMVEIGPGEWRRKYSTSEWGRVLERREAATERAKQKAAERERLVEFAGQLEALLIRYGVRLCAEADLKVFCGKVEARPRLMADTKAGAFKVTGTKRLFDGELLVELSDGTYTITRHEAYEV